MGTTRDRSGSWILAMMFALVCSTFYVACDDAEVVSDGGVDSGIDTPKSGL